VPCDLEGDSTRRPFAGDSFGSNRVSRYCSVYSDEKRSNPAGAEKGWGRERYGRKPHQERVPLTTRARKGHLPNYESALSAKKAAFSRA
jgi:hypothetical protein